MMNPKIRLTGSNSTRNNNMNKYLLAGIVGCALGALVSVKLAGPVLAQDAETKKTIYEPVSYTHLTLPTSDLV